MKIASVLETVLYAADLEAAETFYGSVLGLSVYGKVPGRHVFFRLGKQMLLIFDPRVTVEPPKATARLPVPPHGATGEGHVCFAATATEIEVPSAGELVVAQPRDWADHATVRVDGTVVSPEAGAGPPRYAVASGLREIRIDIQPSHPLARPLSLAWLILVGVLAIPFGTRASRTGERS
jgi:catechol 2,3-dioxygenase-like lactoylglutathione lyase family enzyme